MLFKKVKIEFASRRKGQEQGAVGQGKQGASRRLSFFYNYCSRAFYGHVYTAGATGGGTEKGRGNGLRGEEHVEGATPRGGSNESGVRGILIGCLARNANAS